MTVTLEPVLVHDGLRKDGLPSARRRPTYGYITRGVVPLPDGPYDLVLADPPWTWSPRSDKGLGRSAQRHYPTMSLDAIKGLGADVCRVTARDSVLLMWVTMPLLPEGIETMRAWGFTYKTCAFTWAKVSEYGPVSPGYALHGCQLVKPQLGTGYYTRANAELCLLGTRGKGLPRVARDVPQLILAPRTTHSRKPDAQYDRIARLFGPRRCLEMFARPPHRSGWDVWGFDAVPDGGV